MFQSVPCTIVYLNVQMIECGCCVYVCVRVRACMCMCLCLCVCLCACLCACACMCVCVCVCMCVYMCVCVCVCVCVCLCACLCVTYGDTLVFRNMYALSVAYIYGIKSHASNPTPVHNDIHCSVATGLIYVVL